MSAVKDAEKSVLVFGLDLGRVPTMNTGTLSRKVTEDITAKAAATDGKTAAGRWRTRWRYWKTR